MNWPAPRFWSAWRWIVLTSIALAGEATAQQAPVIDLQPEDTAAPASGSATFRVGAYGGGLGFQWRRDGTNISGYYSTLTLTRITSADAAAYSVVITNAYGAVTSAPARLVVVPVLPGLIDPSFDPGEGPNSIVRAVLSAPDGSIYIAGEFTTYRGVLRRGVAKVLPDGGLDGSFDPGSGASDSVFAIALQSDGKLLVGGAFTNFNGTAAPRIARLLPSGFVDLTFSAGTGPDGPVWSIAGHTNGQILVGGDFTKVANFGRIGLARLNSTGALDTTYAPQFPQYGVRRIVILSDGSALVGGGFTFLPSQYGNAFARVTSAGVVDPNFNVGYGPNGWVSAIVPAPNGQSYIGGGFSVVNGIPRAGVARMTSDGAVDAAFVPPALYSVASVAPQADGRLLVGGNFWAPTQNPDAGRSITRLLPSGAIDPIFYGGADDWVETIAVLPDGSILIGGAFYSVAGWGRPHLAKIIGSDPVSFAPAFSRQPPASSAYRAGMDMVLNASVLAYPTATYRWQFNGQNVPGATSTALVVPNIHVGSAGQYWLIASNTAGVTTSRVAVVTVTPARTNAGAVDIEFYAGSGPDAPVTSLVPLASGKVLVGGWFSRFDGVPRFSLARVETNGSLDAAFAPAFDSFVNSILPLDAGRILVGGSFTMVNGTVRLGLARLTEDGALDTGFSPIPTGISTVNSMALQTNGAVVVAGYTAAGYASASSVARMTAAGAVDSTFNAGAGANGWISQVVMQGGQIIVVGEFSNFGGTRANNIARLNANGSVDTTFATGLGASAAVVSAAPQSDGKIVIAGRFRTFNGASRHQIARLNADGSLDWSFDPGEGPNAEVNTVKIDRVGRILAGGSFTTVNDRAFAGFARFNPDGSPDLNFNVGEGASGAVRAIAEAEAGRLLIGGDFIYVDGLPRPFVAKIISTETAGFAPVIVAEPQSDSVTAGSDVALMVEAAAFPAAGYQWQFNGSNLSGANQWILRLQNVDVANAGTYAVIVSNMHGSVASQPALLDVEAPSRLAGAPDISFHSSYAPNGPVRALLVQSNDSVVVAGDFTQLGGLPLRSIARLLPNGSPDATFAFGAGADDSITALAAVPDGKWVVAGAFKHYSGVARTNVARLLANGANDASFNPAAVGEGAVYALAAQPDGRVLLGGRFNRVGGAQRLSLARLLGDGSLDTSFNSVFDSNSIVRAIAVLPDGRILAGGSFNLFTNQYYNNIVRLNANGDIDATYQTRNVSGVVESIFVDGSTNAIIGGSFSSVEGWLRRGLARLTSSGAVDQTFTTSNTISGAVLTVRAQSDSNVIAGGSFNFVGSSYRGRIARFTAQGALDETFVPGEGASGGSSYVDEYASIYDRSSVLALGIQSDGKIIAGGDFTAFDGMARPYVARLFSRAAADRIFLATTSQQRELRWDTGVLQSSDNVSGPWTTVPNAVSPWRLPTGGTQKFYRLRFNEQPGN